MLTRFLFDMLLTFNNMNLDTILMINRRLIYRMLEWKKGGKINEGTSKILIYIYIYIYSMFIWKIFFINFQIFMSRYLMLKIMDFFK